MFKVDPPHPYPHRSVPGWVRLRSTETIGVRILALIRTLADIRFIIIRRDVVNWLIDDVARTQDAQALEMLHAPTKRIMPRDPKEKPADVFECIRQQVRRMRMIATAETKKARKVARAAGKAKNENKRKQTKTTENKSEGKSHRHVVDERTTNGRVRQQEAEL